MFNFTTQTVYNLISTSGANKNMWVASEGKVPALRIGNTRFDANLVTEIQMKNPTVENLASVEFDMNDILIDLASTDNEITARIVIYVGLSMNDQSSLYDNNFVYKGKPLCVEFPVKKTDTADVVAKRVKVIADKYTLFAMQEKILDVTTTATAATNDDAAVGKVKFTGVNGYQQIKKAVLQRFDPNAKTVDCCTNQGEFVDVVIGVPVTYTIDANGVATVTENKFGENGPEALASNEVAIAPGIEAFGDYNWIIHNLRLPTAANTGFWAPTRYEMPIVGQQYTQFIVRIAKEREGISGEIVGSVAKSITTHVLYVAGKASVNGSPANLVKTELAKLGTIKTDADTALATPFGE